MNERIAKLANESGFDVDKSGVFGNYSEMHRIEKLAELIVQDCVAEVAMMGVTNFENEDISWACRVIIDDIKSKFGV